MRKGVDGFIKERLTQILAARRVSQVQLSTMTGVSAPTISKWRSGQQVPEAEALERLASVVNVKPEWFTRPVVTALSPPMFRSNASAHVAAREMLGARLNWAQELLLTLSDFVDFPSVNIPTRTYANPEEITQADIESAAIECRDRWGLGRGPIADLALAVESAGIVVVREETGVAQIEGLSAWSDALQRPLVLLSADKDNAFRSRLDLAHELGHLVMHKEIHRPSDRQRYKELERQAHAFAGAFLLPAESFAKDLRLPVTLDSLLLLKQRWGVSVAAMIMRIETLGLIGEAEKISLFKRRSARWGAKSEPGDDARDIEQPRLIRRTIDLLAESGVLPLSAFSTHIGLSENDIEGLASLPTGYLSGAGQVVEFARLKTSTGTASVTASAKATGTVLPFTQRKERGA